MNPGVLNSLPQSREVRLMLGDAIREVELLRGLLKLAERADQYRRVDREAEQKSVANRSSVSRRSRNGQRHDGRC